jgi:hypothetical protein
VLQGNPSHSPTTARCAHYFCCYRQALAKVDAATRELLLNSEGPSHGPMTYVGPGASMHRLCHQIISPELNQVGRHYHCPGNGPAAGPLPMPVGYSKGVEHESGRHIQGQHHSTHPA